MTERDRSVLGAKNREQTPTLRKGSWREHRAGGCGPGSEPQSPHCCHRISPACPAGREGRCQRPRKVLAGEILSQVGHPTWSTANRPHATTRYAGRQGSVPSAAAMEVSYSLSSTPAPTPSASPVATTTHITERGPASPREPLCIKGSHRPPKDFSFPSHLTQILKFESLPPTRLNVSMWWDHDGSL